MNEALINVTLPVRNEERVLEANARKLLGFLETNCGHPCEVVIANSGSNDGTQRVAERLAREHPAVRVIHLAQPGRGRALKQTWSQSRADILSYMDVDLSTDLAAFPALIEALITGGNDIATGSRRLPGSRVTRGWQRAVPSRVYHGLLRALFRTRIRDAQCGFKAITRAAALRLLPLVQDEGWLLDTELLVWGEVLGCRIAELPVRWEEDTDSRVKVGRDAVAALKGLRRLRARLHNRIEKEGITSIQPGNLSCTGERARPACGLPRPRGKLRGS